MKYFVKNNTAKNNIIKNFIENIAKKNFIENIAKNFERDHFDDNNIFFKE